MYLRARNETFARTVSDYVGLEISAQCETGSWGAQCENYPMVAPTHVATRPLALKKHNVPVEHHVSNTDKEEAPEVVTNYVYDVPEKKSKTRSDYDDNDELESDDFDDLEEEDEIDDLDFEMRPFISEDEDEMAYFAHRMGGSDFKMLRRHVLHPHGRIRSIWDTFTLFLTTYILLNCAMSKTDASHRAAASSATS
eukprot:jgi/Phyca11/532725/estExt2_fgenesh1_pg.C_PHYCAscaffold_70153